MQPENGQIMRLGHTLLGIVVRENGGAGSVQWCVVVGVVEMPVRIDDEFQRPVADAVQRFFKLGPSRRNGRVDHELTVSTIEDGHVSAGTGEKCEVVGELLRLDGIGGHLGAKRGDRVGRRSAGLLHVPRARARRSDGGKNCANNAPLASMLACCNISRRVVSLRGELESMGASAFESKSFDWAGAPQYSLFAGEK